MPSMQAARAMNMNNYVRQPLTSAGANSAQMNMPDQLPYNLKQSSVMISSVPAIASGVEGITRQFYGGRALPTRRLINP